MPILVKMPKWGLTMKTGKVTEWHKPEGAEIAEGDPLLTVETEKAVNDVEAPASGLLRKIVANEGDEIPVSDPVAVIAAPGETLTDDEIAAFLASIAEEKQAATAARSRAARAARAARPAAREAGGRVNASPAARKLARELGIDLSTVQATGPGGRVTSEDVERAAAEMEAVEEEGVREDYVTSSNGMRLFYVLAGSGTPPLVFLHGLTGSQTTWEPVLPAFVERHRVLALDLPGHGRSDKPAPDAADYSLPGMAAAVARALDALRLSPAVLIGHSLGGAVALQVALDHPERVSRLILVDSAGLGSEINPRLLDLVKAEPSREGVRQLLELFFHDPRQIRDSGVEEAYRNRAAPGGQEALRAIAGASFRRDGQAIDLLSRAGELTMPVLLLWGGEDQVIPAAHARAAAEAITGAEIEVLAGAGHVPHLEDSERFTRAIERFLSAPPS